MPAMELSMGTILDPARPAVRCMRAAGLIDPALLCICVLVTLQCRTAGFAEPKGALRGVPLGVEGTYSGSYFSSS